MKPINMAAATIVWGICSVVAILLLTAGYAFNNTLLMGGAALIGVFGWWVFNTSYRAYRK
jgi:hypothetical protein